MSGRRSRSPPPSASWHRHHQPRADVGLGAPRHGL